MMAPVSVDIRPCPRGELEQRCACVLAAAALELEWHDHVATVEPATDCRGLAGGELGHLDVSLVPRSGRAGEVAVRARVVVHEQLACGAVDAAARAVVRSVRQRFGHLKEGSTPCKAQSKTSPA